MKFRVAMLSSLGKKRARQGFLYVAVVSLLSLAVLPSSLARLRVAGQRPVVEGSLRGRGVVDRLQAPAETNPGLPKFGVLNEPHHALLNSVNATVLQPVGDFNVSATPNSRTVTQGGTVTYSITVQSFSVFNSPVSLSALNLPGNQVLPGTGFSPQTVTPPANGSAPSTLTIVTNSQTPIGTFTITVQGQGSGLTRSTTVSLTVNAPDFTVSATPNSRTVTQGGSAVYTITVQSVNSFNSAVSLTALNLPGNQVLPGTGFVPQTVTPPANSSTTSTLTIVTNNQTPTGTFTITVQGQGGGLTRTTTVNVTVNPAPIPDFTVSATPNSRTVTQGGSAVYTITVQSLNSFNSAVNLTALNLPGNQVLPGTGFSPQTLTPPANSSTTSTLTIVTNNQTPTGTFTITVQGQGGGLTRTTTVSLTVNPAGDFTVSATPNSRTVTQGGSAVYTITVQSLNSFNSAVSLTALNLPGNQVLPGTGFSPQTVTPPANSSTTSTLTIVTNNQTPTGTFTITVQGQGGGLTRTTTVSLTVNPAGDFTVSATPNSRTVTQGGSADYTITVQSLNSFNSAVSLTALNLPGNQVLPGTGFSPQTVTPPTNSSTTSTLTIVTNNQTPTGTFTITVQGQGGGLTRTTTVNVTVNPAPIPDFTVSATPNSRTVTQGGSAVYTITVQSVNSFNSAVSLTALNLPGNQVLPGTGFSPQTVTPPANSSTTSTLTIVTNNQTPTGTFTITVQGQGGGLTRNTPITLIVNPAPTPDFSVSAIPSSKTLTQGGTASYTVTVQSLNGFNSGVSLSALNLPGDQVLPGTGFSPPTIVPPANGSTTSTLNIATNSATPLGTFTITVQGQSGGLTRSTPITLTINPAPSPDFSVSANPTSRSVAQGGIVSYTITVQNNNAFSGPVSLYALNLPNNQVLPGTGFNPSVVTLPMNGSVNSTLSIATNTSTPIGTFTITVEGRSGTVTRSTTIFLTVTGPAPDFNVSAIPPSRVVTQGSTASYTITVQSLNGFSGSVGLLALNLPNNQVLPGTGFNPQTISIAPNGSTTSALKIVTNAATPTGTFTITVQGQGGGLTKSTPVSLTVNAGSAAPTISRIDPPSVIGDELTTLMVTGTGFQPNFTAEVTGPSGTFPILSGGRTFVNSNQVKVQVKMGSSPPYSATLRIRNPDQQNSTWDFPVIAPSQSPSTSTLEVFGIEVTQAIQNLKNDVVLIQDKPTYVRVHVKSGSNDVPNVTGQLIVSRVESGQKIQLGRFEPIAISVLRNPSRVSLTDSFLFKLPPEWSRGVEELEFQGVNSAFRCNEPDGNQDCRVQVDFKSTPTMQIEIVSLEYHDGRGTHKPLRFEVDQVINELTSMYPIPGLDIVRSTMVLSSEGEPRTVDDFRNINTELLVKRRLDRCVSAQGCRRFYLGLLANPTSLTRPGVYGMALTNYTPFCNPAMRGDAAVAYVTPPDSVKPFLSSHELGHDFGRYHTNLWRIGDENPVDACEQHPPDGTIGGESTPLDGASSLYGFDGRTVYPPNRADVMSYGYPQWISRWTYEKIWERIIGPTLASAPRREDRERPLVNLGDSAWLIIGSITSELAGQIDSVYALQATSLEAAPGPGDWAVSLLDGQGTEIGSYSFAPQVSSDSSTAGFNLLLPRSPNTARIILLHNGQVVNSRVTSAHVPTLTMLQPNGGESLIGSNASVTWAGSDADGDSLQYIVQFSPDGGLTWQTLASDWKTTTYDLNLNDMPGTNRGLIRILASDGFNTAQIQSASSFSVNYHAPQVGIRSPENIALVYGDQLLSFDGSAFDVDDGQLADGSMTWSSNLDGALGSGHAIAISASFLTEGTHLITLTARDSDGQAGTASITIQVSRARPTLPPSLSLAPGDLSFSIGSGNVETAADVIAVRNKGDGALSWSAGADQTWIHLGATSGSAPANLSVSANPIGLAPGVYVGHVTVMTSDATNTPQTITVNFTVLTSRTLQFNSYQNTVDESSVVGTLVVTRTGDLSVASSVDYATSDGSAKQQNDYTISSGALNFAPGEASKTISVLISDNAYVDGDRFLNVTLTNPSGGAIVGVPGTSVITILDNDSAQPTTNPLDNSDARFFVRQHYSDFLSRLPDQGGFDFWAGQITQCGTNQSCLRTKRIDVSNAFFFELEYQQTAAYVFRLYRAAYGNIQPFPNPEATNPTVPPSLQIEAKKIPSYAVFSADRARLIGSSNLAQDQLVLANQFVLRPEFLSKYPSGLSLDQFVDALIAAIKTDDGVDLVSQRATLIGLGSRGAVLYRISDDSLPTNPINNRTLIDAEYNRSFVASQYFGYLRRDADIGGFIFWLGQVSGAPLRDVPKQHAMVCSFTTSAEYQLRFSSVVTHGNNECQ